MAQRKASLFIRLFTRLNVLVYRLTGGRMMNQAEGAPICLVTMTGARSNKRKTIALMYTPHGEDVLLVASMGGAPKHPLWYFNLLAHPDIEIQVGSNKRRMRAHQASAEEKAKLWPIAVANYPSFATYQTRTDRDIPVMVCTPA